MRDWLRTELRSALVLGDQSFQQAWGVGMSKRRSTGLVLVAVLLTVGLEVGARLLRESTADSSHFLLPDRALEQVERALNRSAALEHAGDWERWLVGPDERALAEVPSRVLALLDRVIGEHGTDAYPPFKAAARRARNLRAVLIAEEHRAGRAEPSLEAAIATASSEVQAAMKVAYKDLLPPVPVAQPVDGPLVTPGEPELGGWGARVLELRIAEGAGMTERASSLRAELLQPGQQLLRRDLAARHLGWAVLLPVALVALLCLRSWHLPPGASPLPAPWPLRAGVGVFALLLVSNQLVPLMFAPALALTDSVPLWVALWLPVLLVPAIEVLLVLLGVRALLLQPSGLSWASMAGVVRGGAGALIAFGFVVALADWCASYIGVAGLAWGVKAVGGASSESMLAFGATSFAARVLIGPLCEEILFRGVLYGSLRTRLAPATAALLSAAAFAGTHTPQLTTLVATFASGLVLAWAYERARSLVPPLVAHVVHNALVMISGWISP